MVNEALALLKKFIETIPDGYIGPDRTNYILKKVNEFNIAQKGILIQFLNHILSVMLERTASDIEIGGPGAGNYIWFRIQGIKERVKDLPNLQVDEATALIAVLLNENQIKNLVKDRNVDFSYTFRYIKENVNVRFRADAYFELDCLTLNMRAIQSTLRPLKSIGFHPNAIQAMSHKYYKFGLSLITGITGSGKSTTLDAIIDFHNKSEPSHIAIVASPIEYVHTSVNAIIKHREVGRDVASFKDGVTQALRQDPDIVVIGEMRDPDTILAGLEVADTGHKVFSTLHTSSAIESIDRIIAEVNPLEQERVRMRLADILVSVVSQKLIPGQKGQLVLAKEVLVVTPSVKAAIKNNNTSEIYMMMNQGSSLGMITMEQDLMRLYQQRLISQENMIAFANNKTRIRQLFQAV
ncbi:MAG: ATPase, T2SS/T4P/T4SS family [Melioribacteraceae bacterium]